MKRIVATIIILAFVGVTVGGWISIANAKFVISFSMYENAEKLTYVGEIPKPIIVKGFGKKLDTLPTPIRPYYEFLGWYTAREGGELVTSATKSMRLYARWRAFQPHATLYIDGYEIKNDIALKPKLNQSAVFELTNEFFPQFKWDDVTIAYEPADFRGWFYFDDYNNRQYIYYENDTWREHQIMTSHDIALNAIFAQGRTTNVKYLYPNDTVYSTQTARFCAKLDLPTETPTIENFVGWQILDGSNEIFQTNMFLDPRHAIAFGMQDVSFRAVTKYDFELGDGTYQKTFSNGKITMTKIDDTAVDETDGGYSQVLILDIAQYENPNGALFDICGNATNVRDTNLEITTPNHLKDGYLFPPILDQEFTFIRDIEPMTLNRKDPDQNNYFFYKPSTINLPSVCERAVAGHTFVGWENSIDGKIYRAGMLYFIPLGFDGEITFSAVWKPTKNQQK